jgi:hypothetical protein
MLNNSDKCWDIEIKNSINPTMQKCQKWKKIVKRNNIH